MSNKKKNEKKLNFMQKSSIKFVDRDPPFLQKLKASVGYQESVLEDKFSEPTTVADSKEPFNEVEDIFKMKQEEGPQIVVQDPATDLTRQQLRQELKQQQLDEDKKKIDERKITFKRPVVKEGQYVDASAKKIKLDSTEIKRLDNTKLLSFVEDDDV